MVSPGGDLHPLRFVHSGDLGDVIYSLPFVRSCGGGQLFLCAEAKVSAEDQPRNPLTPSTVEFLQPLLNAQPYLHHVEFSSTYPAHYDFDLNRARAFAWQHPLIESYFAAHDRLDQSERSAWLSVDARPHDRVIVNRSTRYHNPLFPWPALVEKFGRRMVFLGLRHEYDSFSACFGKIEYRSFHDALSLAQFIAGSRLFIGNQSFLYALAEGLHVKALQETRLKHANCVYPRPNAFHFQFARRQRSQLEQFLEAV